LDEINRIIIEKCKEEFEFYEELENYVESEVLPHINSLKRNGYNTDDEKELDQAISLLISQGVRIYKSNLILIREGYASNALINLRSLVEVIFNIDYILESDNLRYKRAKKYLNGKINEKIWKKAELSLNRALYQVYEVLCEYTHVNAKSLYRNIKESGILICESDDMVEPTIKFVNGIYYYFIYIICDFYKMDMQGLKKINASEFVEKALDAYKTEKEVVSVFMDILEENNHDGKELLEEYKKFKIKEKEQKRIKANKKRKKKKKKI